MATEHSHIFLRNTGEASDYTRPPRKIEQAHRYPARERLSHSTRLQQRWESIWTRAKVQQESRTAVSMPTKDGVYVEFEGAPGYDLVTKSLEDRGAGIRLLNVYTVRSESAPEQEITRATVFIPTGRQELFLKKIRKYAEENTKKGKPKNADLVQSVEDMRLAVLESFWRDNLSLLPNGITAV